MDQPPSPAPIRHYRISGISLQRPARCYQVPLLMAFGLNLPDHAWAPPSGVTPQQHTSSHWQSTHQCRACVGHLNLPASTTSLRAGPLAAQMQPLTCPCTPPGRPGPGATRSPSAAESRGSQGPSRLPHPRGPRRQRRPRGHRSHRGCGGPWPDPATEQAPPNPARLRHHVAAGISSPGTSRLPKRACGQRPGVKPARANQVPAPDSIAASPHPICHWGSPGALLRSSPAGTANRIST
ncbi:hypothetical protein NDU88_001498 [Pleurodeles waltl]|uniref:Uncharacterized protein n=1 Tax=Pleurodeles waltl TaxID=8319 RepID=A0AAV7U898_PLEWA|nr:hypothetical protein NDU88_001498 [Pleurodeles waltl]